MGRQGEGGGLKILKNEETSFMDDPLLQFPMSEIVTEKFHSLIVKQWISCTFVLSL